MTYLEFLLLFLVLPIGLLAWFQPKPLAGLGLRRTIPWIDLLILLAFSYTTPWDNYLVYRGVWSYGFDRVIGTVGYVPVEEYMFFALQPLFSCLVVSWLLSEVSPSPDTPAPPILRVTYTLWWVIAMVVGIVLLAGTSTLYLGLILAWASPVLAGMAWLSTPRFWAYRRIWALGIGLPTFYLWVADRIAIGMGIWDISDTYSLDFDPLGLPVEEAVFFLVTNVLVVQGLLMFLPLKKESIAITVNSDALVFPRIGALRSPLRAPSGRS